MPPRPLPNPRVRYRSPRDLRPAVEWTAADWASLLETNDYDAGLIAARELRRLLRAHEDRLVTLAYRAGMDWDQIGRRLGMSRQGAWKRWHARFTARPDP